MSIEVNIKKKIGTFDLEVAFDSSDGVLGLLGASGCGKSMTLKCIAGITKPDEGKIVIDGRVLFDSKSKIDIKPQKRHVGYLFQNYALFPNMTVVQNIACGIHDVKDKNIKKEQVSEMIKKMHLDGLEDRKPYQLSGGQQQRTALARILIGSPDILLLDEPFSALDSYLRAELLTELKSTLAILKKDAILVTHSRDEAYEICHDIAVMKAGHITERGKTKELFANSTTVTGAILTGCKNIIDAKKISDTKVEIPSWGVIYDTGRKVPDDIGAIGIRAHYFDKDIDDNSYDIDIVEKIEEPFAWIVKFRYKDATKDSQLTWWRFSKSDIDIDTSIRLGIRPSDIMLLVKD